MYISPSFLTRHAPHDDAYATYLRHIHYNNESQY